MQRLARAQKAHSIYLQTRESLADSDDDEGPQNEDAWLLEDLKVLMQLYSRLRDREQMIALIFEVRNLVPFVQVCDTNLWVGFHSGLAQGHDHYLLYTPRTGV